VPARAYRARSTRKRSTDTRARITAAVHELLAQGAFHEATVEQVAERAGISRATLYQHFGSRIELIDGVCDIMNAHPALVEIRRVIGLPDAREALTKMLSNCVRLWSDEHRVLSELYGVTALDPGARAFVDRQRRDRRAELERLTENLARNALLRPGVTRARALPVLLVLSSFETYRELREAGLSDRQVTAFILDAAARELL
jgi:AcrR family transcriptional regulator